jgi:hypothetical protein
MRSASRAARSPTRRLRSMRVRSVSVRARFERVAREVEQRLLHAVGVDAHCGQAWIVVAADAGAGIIGRDQREDALDDLVHVGRHEARLGAAVQQALRQRGQAIGFVDDELREFAVAVVTQMALQKLRGAAHAGERAAHFVGETAQGFRPARGGGGFTGDGQHLDQQGRAVRRQGNVGGAVAERGAQTRLAQPDAALVVEGAARAIDQARRPRVERVERQAAHGFAAAAQPFAQRLVGGVERQRAIDAAHRRRAGVAAGNSGGR